MKIDQEIRKTFEILKQPNELLEVRVVNGKATFSGYFYEIDELLKCLQPFWITPTTNIYFVLNKIDEKYSIDREQVNTFVQNPKKMTTNNEIVGRDWVIVDVNPKIAKGTSATDEEKNEAKRVANAIYAYLKDKGFTQPITCDSGNGWQLIYNSKLNNNEENAKLIRKFLSALNMMFSNEKVAIDTSLYDACVVAPLYGTQAQKGNKSKTRPHRQTKILSAPEQVSPTRREQFIKVLDDTPKQEEPSYKNNYNAEKFNIDEFIKKHGIKVDKIVDFEGGKKYILKECVFDNSHKSPDACIFVQSDGTVGYHCFHDSCKNYTWKDVRAKFEPNTYEKRKQEYGKQRTTKPNPNDNKPTKEAKKPFLELWEIETEDRSKIVSIPSGFKGLDKKIIGFNKGEISLWSGKNGSGKSSVLSQVCLNACNQGFKVAVFSGELTKQKTKNWFQLQCAGRQNVSPSTFNNAYFVPKTIGAQIDEWLKGKLWVYNNDCGNKFQSLMERLKELCTAQKIDMIVLDNLMALDILTLNGDKYQQQTAMILALVEFVKTYNVHLHIVCHPRKSVSFLRKDDISGTADLTNAVHNVFIVHRVGQDFIRTAKDFFGEIEAKNYYDYGNVIEVCKNRDLGVMDELIGLFYESESKRFLNEKYENFTYGWEKPPTEFLRQDSMVEINASFLPFDDEDEEDGDLPY